MSAKLFLNSWKEIASFVGRSERTVQRWEKCYGFPVRRPAGRERSAVIALAAEIEAWTISARCASGESVPGPSKQTSCEQLIPKPELKPTVLCIDSHSQRLAIRKLVTECSGYRVLTAMDIRSGLRLCNNNRVDVVILESPMHPLDSDSIARQLHRIRPEVPILILSRQAKQIPQAVLNLISASSPERPQDGASPVITSDNSAQHQDTSNMRKSAISLHDVAA